MIYEDRAFMLLILLNQSQKIGEIFSLSIALFAVAELFAQEVKNPSNLDCTELYALKNVGEEKDDRFMNLLNKRIAGAVRSGDYSEKGIKEAIPYWTIVLAETIQKKSADYLVTLTLACLKQDDYKL
ncbi:MAG: hypothetical protein GY705_24630 [Bacteroidetes bacterium]|nr:hypothetical protein [Bacteroidota bacterium]